MVWGRENTWYRSGKAHGIGQGKPIWYRAEEAHDMGQEKLMLWGRESSRYGWSGVKNAYWFGLQIQFRVW